MIAVMFGLPTNRSLRMYLETSHICMTEAEQKRNHRVSRGVTFKFMAAPSGSTYERSYLYFIVEEAVPFTKETKMIMIKHNPLPPHLKLHLINCSQDSNTWKDAQT